ncbi:MAG: hypothetical protein IGS39_18970 [Calothrix sp. C42_A2020_038]|nr:hypothetical protein [Calothrix sp. C42_A2020_038]
MRTRIIVFFLTVTQCFLVGCNLRNQTQRRDQQDPFSTQEPFPSPARGDAERNREDIERGRGDTERNIERNNERNRDDIRERDRENNNTERGRGGERVRRKRVHCAGFVNQLGVCKTNDSRN